MILKQLTRLSVVLLTLFLFSGTAFAQEVEFPLVQSMVYFPYSDNSQLEKGEYSLGMDLHYSNVYMFNHYRTIINDLEMFSGTLRFRYGLSGRPGLNLEVYCRWSTFFGGFLDRGVERFHDFLGLPHNSRDEFPRYSVNYRYRDYFYHRSGKSALSPLTVALFKTLYTSDRFSLKTRVSVGIPLSDIPGLSSSKPFFTGGVIAGYTRDRFSLDFSNYLALTGTPGWLDGESLRKLIFFSRLELRWKRFIGGISFRTSPFEEDDTAHPAYQFYLGYRVNRFLDVFVMEDLGPFDTTPDVGFSIRIKVL